MAVSYTNKQMQRLKWSKSFQSAHRRLPTLDEMATAFDTHRISVYSMIQNMRSKIPGELVCDIQARTIKLTNRQLSVICFIDHWVGEHSIMPRTIDVARGLGITKQRVFQILCALRGKGHDYTLRGQGQDEKRKVLAVVVYEDTISKLQQVAKERELSIGQYVEEILTGHLMKLEKENALR